MERYNEILPICSRELSNEARERIKERALNETLSGKISVEGKATRRIRKKPAAFIVAAAIALTATITAGAAVIANNQSIVKYFGQETAEKLESIGEVKDISAENEHFKVTLNTALNDGHCFQAVISIEGKDQEGKDYLDNTHTFEIESYSGETGEKIAEEGACWDWENQASGTADCYLSSVAKAYKDEKFIILKFHNSPEAENKENLFEGIELKIDTAVNFESVIFESEEGVKFHLSPLGFGVKNEAENGVGYFDPEKEVKFFTENGEKTIYNCDWNISAVSNSTEDYLIACYFRNIMEIDDITAIEVKGVTYTRQ